MAEKEIVEGTKKDLDSVLEFVDNDILTLFSVTQSKLDDEASSSSSSSVKDDDSEQVKELKEDLEEVLQALAKGGNDDDDDDDSRKNLVDEALQIMLSLSKSNLKNNNQSAQTHDLEKLLEWIKNGGTRVRFKPPAVLRPVPTSSDDIERDRDYETLKSILKRLPSRSLTDDTRVLKDLQSLTSKSHYARSFLGWDYPAINKLLTQYSGVDNLQSIMATILFNVCIQPQHWSKNTDVVKYCPATLPFLVSCLTSPKAKAAAAAALSRLSTVESNRKMIGDSGAIERLIGLVKEGERVALDHATKAIWSLCRLDENRERAVSEGAISAVMEKMRSPTFVNRMLQILEMLRWNQRAIGEMEEKDALECLFTVLRDDAGSVSANGKENCVIVIHTICSRSPVKTRKIDEVENGRRILETLLNNGTTEAADKACDLLWKLDFLDLVDRM